MAARKNAGTALVRKPEKGEIVPFRRITEMVVDPRKGGLRDLAGQEFLIIKVELFASRAYQTLGQRWFVQRMLGEGEVSEPEMYTSFSAPTLRAAFQLIGEDGVMVADIDPPVLATIAQQGETFVFA